MPIVQKMLLGTPTTVLSSGLNSLANNALALSAAYDNTIGGGGGDGYILCDVELTVTYGTAPTANTAIAVWLLACLDGTNYEDGGTSVTPARMPELTFPVRAVNTIQIINRRALLPWGLMKFLAKNDGTGQTMAAFGNTLKVRPVTPEGV